MKWLSTIVRRLKSGTERAGSVKPHEVVKFVDGSLDPKTTRRFEERMRQVSWLKDLVEEQRLVRKLLREHQPTVEMPMSPERFWLEVRARIRSRKAGWFAFESVVHRWLLPRLAPAAAVACVMLLLGLWIWRTEEGERARLAPSYAEVESTDELTGTLTFRSELGAMTVVWVDGP